MRLAPFIPLPKDSLRYRLAYLIENVIEHPDSRSERLTAMSCWHLGYRIVVQVGLIGFLIIAAVMGFTIVCGELYFLPELRWSLGITLGAGITFALWEGLRIPKRLHILRRRLCPILMVR